MGWTGKMIAKVCRWLSIFVCLALTAGLAAGAIVNQGEGPDDDFLKAVWQPLDSLGINVVLGNATEPAASNVPRLASLKGYAPKKKDWGSFTREAWPYAFAKGRSGVLFAYKPRAAPKRLAKKRTACDRRPLSLDEGCRFVRSWLAAEPESRVFLSFTNEDFEVASKTRVALEKAGYVVFVFLNGKNEKPWASPALVGEVFAQATHRLVLDTVNARGSAGVQFESLCCEPLLSPSYPDTALSKALAGQS